MMNLFRSAIVLLVVCSAASAFTTTPQQHLRDISNRPNLYNPRRFTVRHVSTIEQADDTVVVDDTTTETKKKKSWDDDGFVFGLQGSGLERPKGKEAFLAVEGDDLQTQPYQVGIVTVTFMAHAVFLMNSFAGMLSVNGGNVAGTVLQSVGLMISSWILADLGSGILHWSVDNYGNGKTPVMGGIIAAFQGHHTAPWTITQRGFCNNVYKLCLPFGILPVALISIIFSGPSTTFFWTVFCILEILSQEFHKWSHQLRSESPRFANTLQKLGWTVSRKMHAQHHLAPYEGNYCIISGVCNEILDHTGVFRWMEHQIYKLNGVESNAWKLDQELKARTLAGQYGLAEDVTKRRSM